tara:strand:- start:2462 stop:2947 length:486 start_codon:yes stop_codon:yes gene_type:complete
MILAIRQPIDTSLSLINAKLSKMKTIITSAIASILLFPSFATADIRSNYNNQQIESNLEAVKCRNLFVNAQFKSIQWRILTGKDYQNRYNVDNVGNIVLVSDDLIGGNCSMRDTGYKLNVSKTESIYSCVYHIEDTGLVRYCETTYVYGENKVERVVNPFV